MSRTQHLLFTAACGICVAHSFVNAVGAEPFVMQDRPQQRKQALQLQKDGNFTEALNIFQKLTLEAANHDKELAEDLSNAVQCLNNLNRVQEFDEFFNAALATHPDNWRLLYRAAQILGRGEVDHGGFLIAGEFERGSHRGGGKRVHATERDRVHSARLLVTAVELVERDATAKPADKASVYDGLATVVGREHYGEAWKLQQLTDLTTLPNYEEGDSGRGYGYGGFGGFGRGSFGRRASVSKGAPVDEDGLPVLHRLPASWQAAATDGERWRWAMRMVARSDPSQQSDVDWEWASFLQAQFGVRVSQVGPAPTIGDDDGKPQRWIVHELRDTETIASLATGAQRISLPDEFNHIVVLNAVLDRNDDNKATALESLISVRMNRNQYAQAVALLERLKDASKGKNSKATVQNRIDQIVKNWVQFESVMVQPAGSAATFDIRYRNGAELELTAQQLDVERFLKDVTAYLESNPRQIEYEKIQIENIGYQLIHEAPAKYLGETVAEWTEQLTPPDGHFDAVKTVTTPLKSGGAYLVSGRMKGGNAARMVIWVADTAISRKRVEGGTLHFISDAASGQPVANADIEFFGWRQERINRTNNYRITTQKFAERSDKNGLCVPDSGQFRNIFRWLTIARTADGRLAYDGFNGVWNPQKIRPLSYSPVKVYCVTDRPVYRPKHDVKFGLWVRQPRFSEDTARFANKTYVLQIRNPKGDVLLEKDVTTDQWAGVDGSWTIPADATLGNYSIAIGTRKQRPRPRVGPPDPRLPPPVPSLDNLRILGQGSFNVEEYRKPEFEVTIDAPDKPVMLGKTIQAKVNAKYYFGAPVTEASVHYKVERTKKDGRWYPKARWDWLYSPGYWWFSGDYDWYPGFSRWGCYGPIPFWYNWRPDPPEVIVEGDAEIGADGSFLIDIETAAALRDHSDSDHNYSITAEVVDQSRRTIIGTGNVLVAREPFRIFVWPHRGHYRTGDTAEVGIQARTPDGKPVAGSGKATLLSVRYVDDKPVETLMEEWDITTAADGKADVKMVLPKAGQFRISVEIKAAAGTAANDNKEAYSAEGGYMLFVRGADDDGRGYRFNDLELITEKREYQPGEKVALQINTNKVNSTVLLFVRPMNGLCPMPKVIRLNGKSTTVDLDIVRDDMPNIFVEAMTIADGRLHSEMREIVVPPERKIANVEVLPSAEKYRPGEEATVRVKLTGLDGKPFIGDTVLSVYDASLEYIAASRIPEIRSFFWNVRRRHNIHNQSTLQKSSRPLQKPNEIVMQLLAGEDPNLFGWAGVGFGGGMGGGGGFGGYGSAMMRRGRALGLSAAGAEIMADSMPMPMAAPAMAESRMMKSTSGIENDEAGGRGEAEPAVRSNFADTAYWVASVTSDNDGLVDVKFTVPDNLTTWKIKAWTLGNGTRVGSGTSDIISTKDLIIRPQTPRFFTETDLITLSSIVHNYLDNDKSTRVVLETEGGQLQILGDAEQTVSIPAGGEVRIDWNVHVVASGDAKVRMKALTDEESDAAELTVPVFVHGILKTESFAGVIRADGDSATVNINVPAARIEEQSRLEVRFTPTLAGAMVDALPYLIEYPYGCTEQTLNRFLPSVITQATLKRMGVSLDDVRKKRTNLNAQELGNAADRAAQWQRYESNPVFDEVEMNRMVKTGVQDLTAMQLKDGGWGWFSGFGERSTAHLTSLVVHGLTTAKNNGVAILPNVISRGVDWLKQYQAEEIAKLKEGDWRRENPSKVGKRRKDYKMQAGNMDAFVAFVLSHHEANDSHMTDYLYRDRLNLSVYAMALSGSVLHDQEDAVRRDMILRNIGQYLEQDDENQTAWLRMPDNSWWYWYGSENEAMARYLQLLLKAEPESPVAPRLVKYLLNNRKHGTYWNSTRDTAIVVEAMADFLKATKEDRPDMTVEILVDGTLQKKVRITADNLFSFDNVMLLQGDAVKTGTQRIELRRTGSGPLYFNAYLTNFTREDPITAAGLEVKVQRRFYRLERDDHEIGVQGDRGQVVDQQTAKYKRLLLENLATVKSGDLVEVELIVESKNDYEYLLLEDRKPSGFEPDDQRSGYIFEGLRAYRELRDERVSFFLSNLARGRHSVSYRLRAETPSQKVSALPTKIEGMYAPELVGNSDEFKLRIED